MITKSQLLRTMNESTMRKLCDVKNKSFVKIHRTSIIFFIDFKIENTKSDVAKKKFENELIIFNNRKTTISKHALQNADLSF